MAIDREREARKERALADMQMELKFIEGALEETSKRRTEALEKARKAGDTPERQKWLALFDNLREDGVDLEAMLEGAKAQIRLVTRQCPGCEHCQPEQFGKQPDPQVTVSPPVDGPLSEAQMAFVMKVLNGDT